MENDHIIDEKASAAEYKEEKETVIAPERAEYEALLAIFDDKRTKKLLRKIDWHLMPTLALLYLVSYMDRTNMGNAKLLGLEEDLGLSPQQYNWALTVFFFPYAFFEVPSNLVLKFLKPSIWLPLIMVLWGVCMMCMGWAQNYSGLITARFFLGVTEAGLFPGATYITTTWYRRNELQFRVALFYCAASLAGSFSGLLAYGIGFMDGIRGYHGWRWIFILEGLLTIIVAAASFFLLCDTPVDVSWLTEQEKRFVCLRLQFDGHDRSNGYKEGPFKWKYVQQAFTDSKVYLGAFMFFITACGTYAISYGLPTIINLLGYTAAQAQLLTIPVYVYACLMCLANGYSADRFLLRSPHLVWPFASVLIGTVIALTVSPITKPGVQYFAMFLIAGGLFPNTPAITAWLANNLHGQWKRAAGMALEFTIGNCLGGVIGSNIFLAKEKPLYPTAYKFEIAISAAGIAAVCLQVFMLVQANKKKAERIAKAEEEGRDLDEECKDDGDKNPYFKYTL